MRQTMLVAAALLLAAPVDGQKLPDWSGVWVRSFDEFAAENERWANLKDPSSPPLSAKGEAVRAERLKLFGRPAAGAEPRVAGACEARFPGGMPQIMRF